MNGVLQVCACGCGTATKSVFAPGHDTRVKGWIKQGRPLPDTVPAEFVERHQPGSEPIVVPDDDEPRERFVSKTCPGCWLVHPAPEHVPGCLNGPKGEQHGRD